MTIDAPALVEGIIKVVMRYHGLLDSIVSDQGSVFISKFWSLIRNFFGIKRKLSMAFYLQIDGQIEKQNSIIKAYLQVFVNFE